MDMTLQEWMRKNIRRPAQDAEQYDLHLAAHEWDVASALQINSQEDFESLAHVDVTPLEHQLQNAILYFRQLAPRGLIADDVGLGKTITAGLIATELLHRGHIDSLLVVCPKALAGQWQEELLSKFRIEAKLGFGQEFDELGKYPFWITSYDTARSKMARVAARKFDMVIIDESHHLKNLYPDKNPPMRATKFLELMQKDGARFVIMLTATPIQNRVWDIFSQIEILKAPLPNPLGAPDRFDVNFIADQHGRVLVKGKEKEFRQRISDVTIRTRRADTKLLFPERKVEDRRLKPTPAEAAYIEKALGVIMKFPHLTQISYARGLMSSPWAAAASFERKAQEGGSLPVPAAQLLQLAREGRAIQDCAKVRAVVDLVREAAKQGNPRVIVFTMRLETLDMLAQALQVAGFGDRVGVMKGGAPEENRRAIRDFLADPALRPVLLASDVGAVGLNLQAGNIVVNYDLPWNPMLIEQRIGRVQRLGQKAKNVVVYNLVLKGTIEEHVVLRLMEKLSLFTQAIGEMEEMLAAVGLEDEDGDSASFERKLMDLIRKSLEMKDVAQDLEKMEQSRRAAEARLAENRARSDSMLASIRPALGDERLEGLQHSEPRIPLRDVIVNCLRLDRAQLNVSSDGTIRVRMQDGRLVELRFERSGFGPSAMQSDTHRVVLPGTAAFNRFTQRIRTEVAHHVRDASGAELTEQVARRLLEARGLVVNEVRILKSKAHIAARLALKASMAVKTDRYERVLEVDLGAPEHQVTPLIDVDQVGDGEGAHALPRASETQIELVAAGLDGFQRTVDRKLETDDSFMRFRDFYAERFRESAAALLGNLDGAVVAKVKDPVGELRRRAAKDVSLRASLETLENRFNARMTTLPVGLKGLTYNEVEVEVLAKHPAQAGAHPLRLGFIPVSGVVTKPIVEQGAEDATGARFVCPGGHLAPADDFQRCHVRGCEAESCEECAPLLKGERRLIACPRCSRTTCHAHSEACADCGERICSDDLQPLPDGRKSCATCLKFLEDGTPVIARDTEVSVVSGKRGPRAAMVKSPVSGSYCFPDETDMCEETGRRLPKNELARDAISGETLGIDLLAPSAVSGRLGRRTKMIPSSLSGELMLPGEEIACEEGGGLFLPDEIGYCMDTGRKVDPRLLELDVIEGDRVLRSILVRSAAGGGWTRPRNAQQSDLSGATGLPSEFRTCTQCGSRALVGEFGVCAESGDEVCPKHLVVCEATGQKVRTDLTGRCEVTDKRVRQSLLMNCPETGKRALGSLFETCEITGEPVLPEGLATCAITGKRVRRHLLVPCEMSRRLGLADQMGTCSVTGCRVLPELLVECPETGLKLLFEKTVQCDETGARLHPSALAQCTASGRTVRASLLGVDDCSGAKVLTRLLAVCELTGTRTLATSLGTCSVTGKRVLETEMVTCEETGRAMVASAAMTCTVTGRRLHPDRTMQCPETGVVLARSAAVTCAASGERVAPGAVELCNATGLNVRKSLLGQDELTGRRVQRSLLGECEVSHAKTLRTQLGVSTVSSRLVSKGLLAQCQVTLQWALSSELATCSRTGKLVLPSLLERCSVSGAWVLPEQLQACEVTCSRALPEYLAHCAHSGWLVLRSQLMASEHSGRLARQEFMRHCAATGRTALADELFTSDGSEQEYLVERARSCAACFERKFDLSEGGHCQICGCFTCRKHLAKNEVCSLCRGLLRGTIGRKASAMQLSAVREHLSWASRCTVAGTSDYRHLLVRPGWLSWGRAPHIVVYKSDAIGNLVELQGAFEVREHPVSSPR